MKELIYLLAVKVAEHSPYRMRRAICIWYANQTQDEEILKTWKLIDAWHNSKV